MDRVHYFSDYDLSIFWQFNRIQEVMEDDLDNHISTIDDVIELYSIFLVLKTGAVKRSWTKHQIEKYTQKSKQILPMVGKYFSLMDNYSFLTDVTNVNPKYMELFWRLFDKNDCYEKISGMSFNTAINKVSCIFYILHYKKTTFKYKHYINEMLLSKESCWTMYLRYCLLQNNNHGHKLFFSQVLSKNDITNIINNYVNSSKNDPTLLKIISESKTIDNVKVSLDIRILAKQKYEKIINDVFKQESSQLFTTEISLKCLDKKISKVSTNKNRLTIIYNRKWLDSFYDFSTIMNNLIYVFGLVDRQCRWSNIVRKIDIPQLISLVLEKGKREYPKETFDEKRGIIENTLYLYNQMLKDKGVQIELLIKYFFEHYLVDEFQVKGFKVNIPKGDMLSKTRNLLSEMNSILKQYNIYCKLGYVDREFLELDTESLNINNVNSIIKDKYIYPTRKIHNLFAYLYSNQSLLFYKSGDKFETPYQKLKEGHLTVNDVSHTEKRKLTWLVNNNFLRIQDNKITFDRKLLSLCKDLYDWRYCDRQYLLPYSNQISKLKEKGMITFSSSLLSQQEKDLFNFIMNNSKYSNSLDLRNKYLHGNQSDNENQNRHDYFLILSVFLIIIIKINEELCQKNGGNLLNDKLMIASKT